jgi:adenine/guanine phosphoribosyltransferase-like PRPP-binding protein
MDNEYTAEETAQAIKAMGDSVTVIDDAIASGLTDEETLDAIDRNVRHIEIMLAKDHIKESGADLKPFESAVKRGKAV